MSIKVYMICPVRNCTPAQRKLMDKYVRALEAQGKEVHYPPRDVDQANDDGGVRICREHLVAMACADECHVWWDNTSSGSHFDLGMAVMADLQNPLRIYIANPQDVQPVEDKSFQNVLLQLAKETHDEQTDPE